MSLQNLPRDFKGIWIPKEIWLHEELSPNEKFLWAEIDSLDTVEEGCYASNEYFCNFFKCSERELQRWMAKLKKLDLVKVIAFDGRKRVLRSSLKPGYDKCDTRGVTILSPPPRQKCHPSSAGDFIERENKVYNKDKKSPPLISSKPKQPEPVPQKEEWRRRISSAWKDEEFEYAYEKLQQSKTRVVHIQRWLEKTMQEYRNTNGVVKSNEDRIKKHFSQALKYDEKRINGDLVHVKKDGVEFTSGSFYHFAKFDVPEKEWESLTKRWFKNENTKL